MEETRCNLEEEAAQHWAKRLTKKDILWMREQKKKEGATLRVEFGGKYYQVTVVTDKQVRLRLDTEYKGDTPLPKPDLSEIMRRALANGPQT